MFKKKPSAEDLEKDEIFKDVVSRQRSHGKNKKDILKYKKNLENKFMSRIILFLLMTSVTFISIDVYMALSTDAWSPIRLEDLLSMVDIKLHFTKISVVDWFLSLPMFGIAFILFVFCVLVF